MGEQCAQPKVACMKKDDIDAVQSKIDAIAHRNIHNPDDTGDLSSPSFRRATDAKTQQQLEELEEDIEEKFVDGAGFADIRAINQARKAGVPITYIPAQDPADDDESVIQVTLGDHGTLTVVVQQELYR